MEDYLIREIDRIGELLAKDAAVLYLVENEHITEKGLEAFTEIIFHSDCEDAKKSVILKDATQYLDSKGYYSFRLHSLMGE